MTNNSTTPQPQNKAIPTRLLIVVHGGEVRHVACSDVNAKIALVDWNPEGLTDADETVVQIGEPPLRYPWRVLSLNPSSFAELSGTDEELLLQPEIMEQLAANDSAERSESPTRVVICTHRYRVNVVACSDPDAISVILDRDGATSDLFDPALTEICDGGMARETARKFRLPVVALSQLAGTEIMDALQARGLADLLPAECGNQHGLPIHTEFPWGY